MMLQTKIQKNSVRTLLVCMALAAALVLTAPCAQAQSTQTQSAQAQVSIPYAQTFASSVQGAADTFFYRLTAAEGAAPLPNGAAAGVYRWAVKGSDSGSLCISYAHAGIYTYDVSAENAGAEGYTYDSHRYTVTVYVRNDAAANGLTAALVVTDESGKKQRALAFDPSCRDLSEQTGGAMQGWHVPQTSDRLPVPLLRAAAVCFGAAFVLLTLWGRSRFGRHGDE